MLEIKDAYKLYRLKDEDVVALNHVNMTIADGSLLGIMGVSGAGKTTLLRSLALLEPLTSGQILLDGVDLTAITEEKKAAYRKKIGVVFQGYHLFEQQTVFQNIAYPLKIRKVKKEEILQKVSELIQLVGLDGKEHAYPVQLSGGQKQRVAIARALACEPSLLLCDEPTSALDSMTTKSILQLLADINQKKQVTIVIITHELHVVKSICQQVCIINDGEFVEYGSVKEVLEQPKHAFTKFLVGGELHG